MSNPRPPYRRASALAALAAVALALFQTSCGDEEQPADQPGAAYVPCAGKACGDECTLCPPDDPTCVESAVVKTCRRNGQCMPGPAECNGEYDPCEGKQCGDSCTVCPPDDPSCVETQVLKECDAQGRCEPAPAACA